MTRSSSCAAPTTPCPDALRWGPTPIADPNPLRIRAAVAV
jgi:hypothetical protein